MKIQVSSLLFFITIPAVFMESDLHPLSDEFIDAINREQSAWRAGRNFDINTPLSYLSSLGGMLTTPPEEPIDVKDFCTSGLEEIPESFDARERWPECQSLRHIRDQAACGSCWKEWKNDVLDNGPLSLTNLSKIFVKLLFNRINISGASSLDLKEFQLTSQVCDQVVDTSPTPGIFLDLAKDFDTINQSLSHSIAVSGASAMTDRLCIKSGGNITTSLSAADIMTCSTINGCQGGSTSGPWSYWKRHGIPSGGDYGSNDGCVNYPFPSCATVNWSRKPSCGPPRNTPACKSTCDSNRLRYNSTLTYGKNVYRLRNEEEIKREILDNGPVEGGFKVYEDFYSYTAGVYHYVRGKFVTYHAIKILGWGEENGMKYWLAANSWNEEWGDNGFFKIRRGNNELEIEDYVYAGEPRL